MSDETDNRSERNTNDAPSYGFALLGFAITLVGLILFGIWRNSRPLRAKSCITGASYGIITGAIFYILLKIDNFRYTTTTILILFILIIVAQIYGIKKSCKGEPESTLLKVRITRFFPLICILSIFWIIFMLGNNTIIADSFSGYRAVDRLPKKMTDKDFWANIIIGNLIGIIGCILLITHRKNAIFIALIGAIIKIQTYIINNNFLRVRKASMFNLKDVTWMDSNFYACLLMDLGLGLIILLLILKQNKKPVSL